MNELLIENISIKNVGPFTGYHEIKFAPLTLLFGKNSVGKTYLLRTLEALTAPFKTKEQLKDINRIERSFSATDPMEIEWQIPKWEPPDEYGQFKREKSQGKKMTFQMKLYIETKTRTSEVDETHVISYPEPVEMDYIAFDYSSEKGRRQPVLDRILVNVKVPCIAVMVTEDYTVSRLYRINPHWRKILAAIPASIEDNFKEIHTSNLLHYLKKELCVKRKYDILFIEKLNGIIMESVRNANFSINRLGEQIQYVKATRLTPKPVYRFSEFIDSYPPVLFKTIGYLDYREMSDNYFGLIEHKFSLKEYVLAKAKLEGRLLYSKESDTTTDDILNHDLATVVDVTNVTETDNVSTVNSKIDSLDKNDYLIPDEEKEDMSQPEFEPKDILEWDNKSEWQNVVIYLISRIGYPEYDFFFDFLEVEHQEKMVKISISKNRSERHELDQIGFGISQILPVLFAIGLRKGRLFVEEPEIHLHPSAQLSFISALIDLKNNGMRPFHYIFETHSEIFIRAIQAAIKNKDISVEDVSISYLFCQDSKSGCKIRNITIGEDGFMIDKWPEEFFSINYDLARELWL